MDQRDRTEGPEPSVLSRSKVRESAGALESDLLAWVHTGEMECVASQNVYRFSDGSRIAARFEMGFNFFQRFALGLRQEERRNDEVDHRETGEEEEDRRVAVFADEGQEDAGQRG